MGGLKRKLEGGRGPLLRVFDGYHKFPHTCPLSLLILILLHTSGGTLIVVVLVLHLRLRVPTRGTSQKPPHSLIFWCRGSISKRIGSVILKGSPSANLEDRCFGRSGLVFYGKTHC